MRILVLSLALCASPALAWELLDTSPCTLFHDGEVASVTIVYDGALYTLHVDQQSAWHSSPYFAMRFDGRRPLTISTDRHIQDGTRLTVQDRGFANVLNGLRDNQTATAFTQSAAQTFDLTGAAAAVDAFKRCTQPATS